ncbi:hypothetical protein G5C51_02360 [Streptomyces sp. A7024]|uniref:non-reducing end alpha-L-arabinofuranosidase n=1 Tax=Streptomyces coryli TaxID=1128680 RepID=A0A6G4TRX8_9ACTN|nr:hypothetical protein [Streptomyces coryli]NGN62745.1 hypothetical protein [Streptomyces coryli]
MHRRTALATALGGLLVFTTIAQAAPAAPRAEAADVTITVGTEATAATVRDQIVGANHRWPRDGLGMWDTARNEPSARMVELAKQTRLKLVRYPGGTVANLYDWKRAIGPQHKRGCQVGGGFVGGGGEPMDSRYGPDENERFVEAIGARTTVMTNGTTQTPRDAGDYVEYMNAEVGANPNGGTDWAKVRADNGHQGPYDVRVWEVGNELYLPNQAYWRAENLDTRLRQFAFGGTQRQQDQPLGSACDHRPEAGKSDGSAGQEFQVWYPPVVPGSATVRVGGEAWRRVADLGAAASDAAVYELNAKTGQVRFGDGTHGRIPPADAPIRADYDSGPHAGFTDFYAAMKKADPSISVCSPWEKPAFVQLMGREHAYDCIGPHLYLNRAVAGTSAEIHDRFMPEADKVVDGELDALEAAIKQYGPGGDKRPFLEVSEYGTINSGNPDDAPAGWAGSMTNVLIQAGHVIGMADHSVPLAISSNLNADRPVAGELFGGAPDFTDTGRARMLGLVSKLAGSTPVQREVQNNPQATGGGYPALRVLSTRAEDGTVRLLVLNRDREQAVTAGLALPPGAGGKAKVHTLNGAEISSYNSADDPDALKVTTAEKDVGGGGRHTFPAHSVTLFEVPV